MTKGKRLPSVGPVRDREHETCRVMTPEIQHLRKKVHCAALLEHQSPPWKIDRKESTKHCLKYRRGSGEILMLNQRPRLVGPAERTLRQNHLL